MPTYTYPNDGKLHTRYSELVRCTPGQINRVVMEHFGEMVGFSSDHTGLGTERHKDYAEEMIGTKRLPDCFRKEFPQYEHFVVDIVEKELKAEVMPGVVLHSTPDAASSTSLTIIDFKVTSQEAKRWSASKQILVYAWQLHIRDIPIERSLFLIEQWNPQKTKILRYDVVEREITPDDIAEAYEWICSRCTTLREAIDQHHARQQA